MTTTQPKLTHYPAPVMALPEDIKNQYTREQLLKATSFSLDVFEEEGQDLALITLGFEDTYYHEWDLPIDPANPHYQAWTCWFKCEEGTFTD